jgi:hypothetical protein
MATMAIRGKVKAKSAQAAARSPRRLAHVACPCTFAQAPDNGFCESVLFWHVREGHYGDVKLDNMSFVRVGRWEGDLWARNATGVAGLYIDEHADDRQMEALPTIIGGRAGGFPAWVNECFAGDRPGARHRACEN